MCPMPVERDRVWKYVHQVEKIAFAMTGVILENFLSFPVTILMKDKTQNAKQT